MTLYQAAMYMGALTPEDGQVKMKPGEYRRMFGPQAERELKQVMGGE